MTIVWLCRFSSLLCLLLLFCASLVSVVPDAETAMAYIMLTLLVLSVSFAVASVLLRHKLKRTPESVIFQSKILVGIFVGIVLLLAVFFISAALG